MADTKAFIKDDLTQKVPKKIIAHFLRTNINKDETVLAVFGNLLLTGIDTSVLSTQDRLIYLTNGALIRKTIVTLYSDISSVELKQEGKFSYIYLSLKNGETVKYDIKANPEETQKMFEFINGYYAEGTTFINEKSANDKKYAKKIEAIGNHINEKIADGNQKIADNNERYQEQVKEIHEHYQEKIEAKEKDIAELREKIDERKNAARNAAMQNGALMYLSGLNGQIELYQNRVVITRSGMMAMFMEGLKGNKEIYLRQITGIQLKLAGLTYGYIQFTIPGGIEDRGGIYDATTDENTVTFTVAENETANAIKSKIAELMDARDTVPAVSQLSTADEIKKFKDLLDTGAITQDEFDAKKKQLLGL